MNLYFKPEQIADLAADSDSMARFIASLSAEQARQCIHYELDHEERHSVLALLGSQVSIKTPVRELRPEIAAPATDVVIEIANLSEDDHTTILNALHLSRAHVRYPLEGGARADLVKSLDAALALLGSR